MILFHDPALKIAASAFRRPFTDDEADEIDAMMRLYDRHVGGEDRKVLFTLQDDGVHMWVFNGAGSGCLHTSKLGGGWPRKLEFLSLLGATRKLVLEESKSPRSLRVQIEKENGNTIDILATDSSVGILEDILSGPLAVRMGTTEATAR